MRNGPTLSLGDEGVFASAAAHLSKADHRLGRVISRLGVLSLSLKGDLFLSLVESVLSQQLTPRAADSIIERFIQLFPARTVEPRYLLDMDEDRIRSCGVSRQKISYLRNISESALQGFLDMENFVAADDEEVMSRLTTLRGVGVWTAKMILIFSLGRTDVLPYEDLGVLNAMSRVYVLGERPDRATAEMIAENWHPYCSVASLYLWKLKDELPWENEW